LALKAIKGQEPGFNNLNSTSTMEQTQTFQELLHGKQLLTARPKKWLFYQNEAKPSSLLMHPMFSSNVHCVL
jgi:hypothetical protein